MSAHPRARSDGIVSEPFGDELVVYVEATQTAHSLSPHAASIWRHCDGSSSLEVIARSLALEEIQVADALEQLARAGLLEQPHLITRRQASKRMATVGAAAFSAPLIYSVAIQPASAAASVCSSNCPPGTIIACGTGAGQCSAQAGEVADTSACSNGVCYRGVSNNICNCIPGGCRVGGFPCPAPPGVCCGACVGGMWHVEFS